MTPITPNYISSACVIPYEDCPPEDKLSNIERKALVKLRAVVMSCANDMLSLPRLHHSTTDINKIAKLVQSPAQWEAVIEAERRNINTELLGAISSMEAGLLIQSIVNINNSQEMPNNKHISLIHKLISNLSSLSKNTCLQFERLLLEVLGQVFFKIHQKRDQPKLNPMMYDISPETRSKIIRKRKLLDNDIFCMLNKIHEYLKLHIYLQEEDGNFKLKPTLTATDNRALKKFIQDSAQNYNRNFITQKIIALDTLLKSIAPRTMQSTKSSSLILESKQIEKSIDSSYKKTTQSLYTLTTTVENKHFNSQLKRKVSSLRFKSTLSLSSLPFKKRFKNTAPELTQTSSSISPSETQTRETSHVNHAQYGAWTWLNPDDSSKISPLYEGEKLKINHILIPSQYSSYRLIRTNISESAGKYFSLTPRQQEQITQNWVDVKSIQNPADINQCNKNLLGQYGGFAKKDILLEHGHALCLGLYRGVLIDSTQSYETFRASNPYSCENSDRYSFNLVLDKKHEETNSNEFHPFLSPVIDHKNESTIIGLLPYINTYLKHDRNALTTDDKKVNVQIINLQTNIGQKNKLYDLIGYFVISNNPDKSPTHIKKGEQLFVDYGQDYIDIHLKPNATTKHGLNADSFKKLNLDINTHFPLYYMDTEGAINSHESLLKKDGHFKLQLVHDTPVIKSGKVYYKSIDMGHKMELVKSSAEHYLNMSSEKRGKFLEKHIALKNSNGIEHIVAGENIPQGTAFIYSGITYMLDDRNALADMLGATEQQLDADSYNLDLLSVTNQQYFIGAVGHYRNFLADIPDVHPNKDQTSEGNLGIMFARTSVAAQSEPPDCVIFYALNDISKGTPLKRLPGF